ncbi:hypothetical protein [Luteococcus sp. OSA5]|uniref:hypothetical protein n=1 Tax=Luteococcus sp. OSA5 TaxID=3401630 RepID=UPI003B437295
MGHDERRNFANALSRAMKDTRTSLRSLQSQLAGRGANIDQATLDYWRRGEALPAQQSSLRTLQLMEEILALGPGHLSSLLPKDSISRWDQVREAAEQEQVQRALEVMGLPSLEDFEYVFVQDHVRVRADHRGQFERSKHMVRATVDGLESVPVSMRMRFLTDPPPRIRTHNGCVLRDVVQLDDEGLFCANIALPRPLRKGELHMFDYSFDWGYSRQPDSDGLTRLVRDGLSYWAVVVDFEGDLPQSIYFDFSPDGAPWEGDGEGVRQTVRPQRQVQRALRDPARGFHNVSWVF